MTDKKVNFMHFGGGLQNKGLSDMPKYTIIYMIPNVCKLIGLMVKCFFTDHLSSSYKHITNKVFE